MNEDNKSDNDMKKIAQYIRIAFTHIKNAMLRASNHLLNSKTALFISQHMFIIRKKIGPKMHLPLPYYILTSLSIQKQFRQINRQPTMQLMKNVSYVLTFADFRVLI